MDLSSYEIAAIVPCHNEALAVASVVRDLKAAVPGITVYVYDNLSTDGTAEVAAAAGAIVRRENVKGKGNVIHRAFADIEADIYVMIDGDDTYDAFATPDLVRTLIDGPHDHVLGVREQLTESAYRAGHAAGNRAFNRLVGAIFGMPVTDMLSGFRVFSRRFVKSFPAVSREFEIETELTVHCVSLRVSTVERPVGFGDRPEGSESKLSTYRDGLKILRLIVHLMRLERPVLYYGLIGSLVVLAGLVIGVPVVLDFIDTGLVAKFPSAFLAAILVTLGIVTFMIGIVLDAVTKARREAARLNYLGLRAVR
ncbi:glycosyltransferase [Nocardioides sp. W7]|uniref:glycosyltransferase n=1 Tax=Nocardioides sp. W7 TaxID=2931390 RepID=UPI001FCFC2BD|nr:glycosyltransferase [Nocardioides sp. W7]